jgi:hypothetical protein
VTVLDHPERTQAEHRGDLAESLVPVAAELAWLVRDEGREAIGKWLDEHGITDDAARALLVVLAAMVPAGAAAEQLLDYVTWDEDGRPLDGTAPLFPALPVADDDGEHGNYAAYLRHARRGATKEQLEECGCAQAARDHWNERYQRRKGTAKETSNAAA